MSILKYNSKDPSKDLSKPPSKNSSRNPSRNPSRNNSRNNSKHSEDSGDDSKESSEDENESIVKKVFKKYAAGSRTMTLKQFSNVIANLSLHLTAISMKENNVDAVYYYFISGKSEMDLDCFKKWWLHPDKIAFFGKKSKTLLKAFKLYKKYSSIRKKGETLDIRKMDIKEFTILLEDLGLTEKDDEIQEEEFDLVDTDGDGMLSFREFCDWLDWF
jgi:Ca2+-binding EF-hand superfamily protein